MEIANGRVCPYCGNKRCNMVAMKFIKNTLYCPRCSNKVPELALRMAWVKTSKDHWAHYMPVINPDKVSYRELATSIFDHIHQKPVDPDTGKVSKREPLKAFKNRR